MREYPAEESALLLLLFPLCDLGIRLVARDDCRSRSCRSDSLSGQDNEMGLDYGSDPTDRSRSHSSARDPSV